MNMTEDEYFSVQPKVQKITLIPYYQRFQKQRFPGMIPVIQWDKEIQISTCKSKEQRNQIRPLIGILTSDGGKSFRGNHQNFVDLIRTGRTMGVTVFVLTPRSLLDGSTMVEGHLLDHATSKIHWIPAKFSMPDVIYNRIPTRKSEQCKEVQQAIQQLRNTPGVHFFNPSFFNKWSLYQQLLTYDHLGSYLPATMKLDHLKVLQYMITKYPILYLKPIDGKAGIGMMKVISRSPRFELIYQSAKEKKKYTASSLHALWKLIRNLRQNKEYIIQQGIELAEFRGRPFDVRMLLQKDSTGNWDLSGAGIRVAGEAAISTHVPMGGSIKNIHVVLNEVFGMLDEEMYKKIKNIGIHLAKCIEEKQSANLAEMSIDLGIESNGRMWFFEANSKPMKFDEPEIRTRSLIRLIQYSLFLCGSKRAVGGISS